MEKISLVNLKSKLKGKYDIFVCCSSFENRCLSIAYNINTANIGQAYIFYSQDQGGKIQENLEKLLSVFLTPQKVGIYSDNPVKTIMAINDSLMKDIKDRMGKVSILIDVSTFTHETLLMLFRLLMLHKDNVEISVCYNNVLEYSYNVSVTNEKWLTKGVGDVRNIIGYPGYINPARKNHLIILFGFEIERTIRIIEKFEPDLVSIGFGTEETSISSEHFKINQERHKQLQNIYPNINIFNASLVDAYRTKENILNQINKFPEMNVIIAPMNTKISTIGAALAFFANPDIQICYVKANLYNTEGYSKPGKDVYLFNTEFASC